MFDTGADVYATIQSILSMYRHYRFETKILAAALKTTDQLISCAAMGIHAATLKDSLFAEFVSDNPFAVNSMKTFAEDWEARTHQNQTAELPL